MQCRISAIESRDMVLILLIIVGHRQDARQLRQKAHLMGLDVLIRLDDHQGVTAPLVAAQAHIGHVDPQLAEDGGDGGQSTVFIVVADHQRVVVSGEADVNAVQLIHLARS